MCYQPLLAKPIICKVAGRWRYVMSGHAELDRQAKGFCRRLNGLY